MKTTLGAAAHPVPAALVVLPLLAFYEAGVWKLAQAGSLLVGAIPLRNALNERDLPDSVVEKPDWRCRIGRHRYVGQQDDNPEMRGRGYLRCVRCGRPKDPPSFGVMPPEAIGSGW